MIATMAGLVKSLKTWLLCLAMVWLVYNDRNDRGGGSRTAHSACIVHHCGRFSTLHCPSLWAVLCPALSIIVGGSRTAPTLPTKWTIQHILIAREN